jgi:hypothetical protein
MSDSNHPEEKVVSTTAQTTPATPACTPKIQHLLIGIAAIIVCASFFMPWVSFLGANMSGLDIQKNFTSYKLVWLLPTLAIITFLLNIVGVRDNVVRRIAGLCPFIILAYALNQMGSDLFKIVMIGGWLALIGGAMLICIPNGRKPVNPA